MSTLSITTRRSGPVSILDLDGQIRLGETNINLHKAVHELVDAGEKRIILNLANVTGMDSSGLGELVASHATMERNGGEMKLLKLTDRLTEIMMITKLLTVFDVYEKEDVAVASFGSGEASAGV
ncbi:MAG: STAS domain-containing protein [Pyrinomonadaceae bacterium]